MKRRKFFRLATAGVAGAALQPHAGIPLVEPEFRLTPGDQRRIPDYRQQLKQFFPQLKLKGRNKVILALIGAGSWGTSLILEAAKSVKIYRSGTCVMLMIPPAVMLFRSLKDPGIPPISVRICVKSLMIKISTEFLLRLLNTGHALQLYGHVRPGKTYMLKNSVTFDL